MSIGFWGAKVNYTYPSSICTEVTKPVFDVNGTGQGIYSCQFKNSTMVMPASFSASGKLGECKPRAPDRKRGSPSTQETTFKNSLLFCKETGALAGTISEQRLPCPSCIAGASNMKTFGFDSAVKAIQPSVMIDDISQDRISDNSSMVVYTVRAKLTLESSRNWHAGTHRLCCDAIAADSHSALASAVPGCTVIAVTLTHATLLAIPHPSGAC